MTAEAPQELGDGLILRAATDHDVERIVALSGVAHGPDDEEGARFLLSDAGASIGNWSVVADGDRIVSIMCLASMTLRVSGVDLQAGWPEYVATDPEYRHRGLIRHQFARLHRRSEDRGDLLQVIQGIMYMYRRLGYSYALDDAPSHQLRPVALVDVPEGWTVRETGPEDQDVLLDLHARCATADVQIMRTPSEWAAILHGVDPHARFVIAEHDGKPAGSAKLFERDGYRVLLEVAAPTLDAARALIGYYARADRSRTLVTPRPGTAVEALLHDIAAPMSRRPYAFYVRIPDPVAYLEPLRPVLSRRLANSPYASDRGTLGFTTYTGGFAIHFDTGEVTAITPSQAVSEAEHGTVGVPPDVLPELLLGTRSVRDLDAWHPDVSLGTHTGLVATLFPKLTHDVWFPF